MRTKFLLFIALTIMTVSCKKQQTTGIHLENLDTTVVAQNDFYQYACGGWMANNPLTPEYSRFGSFDKLAEDNNKQVNELIEEIANAQKVSPKAHGSIEQKIGDLYNLVMDTTRRNAEGIAPVVPELQAIEAIADRSQLATLLGKEDYALWGVYVDADEMNSSMNILHTMQGGYNMGNRDYYFDNDDHTKNIRAEYLKYIEKMFTLFGYNDGAARAKTIMRLETRLAKVAKNNVELRDPYANYNKMSIAELKVLVPQVDWDAYFAAMNISTDSLSVGQVEHLKEAGKMLADEPLEDLKTLFLWQTISGASGCLTDEIYATNFDFYGRVMSGRTEQRPLWKRAVGIVNGVLGEAVGQMYVAKYFPPEAKERMIALVKNLQTSLGERIDALTWMSSETKAKAHEKLGTFYVKVGYPDKWRDYTALDIDTTESYYANLKRAAKFDEDYALSFLDKPVDREKWYMTPQTVNAYYNPATNEICFPAGILQYPFFDMNADDAFNYGAIGVVIGHEMTHGFDDQGSQFDKDGNLSNWWTDEDRANFEERTKVMEEYFNKIEVAPGVFANGKFTLGENIADHGGLQISYQAFKNAQAQGSQPIAHSPFTPDQRFFLAYANVWAGNIRPEAVLQRTKTDPHSLGRWRVNGALPHIAAWYEAWNVTEESPMYLAPENRVSIW